MVEPLEKGEKRELGLHVEPFEKVVESTPLSRVFWELLRSEAPQAGNVAEEPETLDTDLRSLIVEGNDYAFYT